MRREVADALCRYQKISNRSPVTMSGPDQSPTVSEFPIYTAAANSIIDQEHRRSFRRDVLTRRYSSFDLVSSKDNDDVIAVAKSFLSTACPELLDVLDSHYDQIGACDRLVKIGRNVIATMRYGHEVAERKKRGGSASMEIVWTPQEEKEILGSESERVVKTEMSLKRLVRECKELAQLLKYPVKIPTVRYGRTGIQMPIVTLGCMRFQQSWNRGGGKPITTPEQLEGECQENLVKILRHAFHCGMNHIETAKGYGCSELQLGLALISR